MKKLLRIFGVAAIALTLFVNTNMNDKEGDLTDLIAINIATADILGGTEQQDRDECSSEPDEGCRVAYEWIQADNGQYAVFTFYGCEIDKWYTLADCQ